MLSCLLPSTCCLLSVASSRRSWRTWRLGGSAVRLFTAFALLSVSGSDIAAQVRDTTATASDTSSISPPRKSPRSAALRSLALPGWGQFYNDRPIKGGIMAAACAASIAGIVIRQRQINREPPDSAQPRRNVFLFTTLGLLFYSAVDAYVDASFTGDNVQKIAVGPGGNGVLTVRLIFPVIKGGRP